jgi:ribosomal protein S18 acetylase RimI-like enzyme
MLEAYSLHPDAFTSSAAERAKLPLEWWERRLSADEKAKDLVLGAFIKGMLSGVVGLAFEEREKTRHKASLFGMYVPSRHRNKGLGSLLVRAALSHAQSRPGVRVVQLTVTAGNVAAQSLYERHGFVPFGFEPFAVLVASSFVAKVHMWYFIDRNQHCEQALS